ALALGLVGLTLALRGRRQISRVRQIEEMVASAEGASLVGMVMGGYRLSSELGGGGMARVFLAVPEESLDRAQAVAVKVVQRELAQDEEFNRRFQREIKVLAGLNHRNIVRIYDFGEKEGRKYLVMELREGGTVRQRIRKGGLPPLEVVRYLEPLVAAVAFAHSCGVVHRDLKPENLMLTEQEDLKVMDFGLARRCAESERLTQTGASLGTPNYMAPEQIRGTSYDPAIDQYALGVIAYELLTGQPPFHGDDPLQVLFMHVSEPARPPSEVRPGIPPEVDAAVLRMLAKSPAERFASVEEAGSVLMPALRAWGRR
ncbi:MAG: serine/threonine-protein kinase, partial [Candidatus Eremiobacterota bacterium]